MAPRGPPKNALFTPRVTCLVTCWGAQNREVSECAPQSALDGALRKRGALGSARECALEGAKWGSPIRRKPVTLKPVSRICSFSTFCCLHLPRFRSPQTLACCRREGLSVFFSAFSPEGSQDPQGGKATKRLKRVAFPGILRPSERVYLCRKHLDFSESTLGDCLAGPSRSIDTGSKTLTSSFYSD